MFFLHNKSSNECHIAYSFIQALICETSRYSRQNICQKAFLFNDMSPYLGLLPHVVAYYQHAPHFGIVERYSFSFRDKRHLLELHKILKLSE